MILSPGKSQGNGFGMAVPGRQHGLNQHDLIPVVIVMVIAIAIAIAWVVIGMATVLDEGWIKRSGRCQSWEFHSTTMTGIGHEGGYCQ